MFEQGRGLLRNWLNSVETQLRAEAQRAGLFRQPSMTGNAREEVIRKALRGILPRQIEVGAGRVIGADSEPSKQVDVIVFDGRFPVLRMGSDALYPVEGVIATIEVKSELTENELRGALDNAASVMQISPSFVKEDADAWLTQREATGATREQAFEELVWHLMPRTYVHAFHGLVSTAAQTEALGNCLSAQLPATPSRPLIPSVIVGGAAVTIALGNPVRVEVHDAEQQRQIDQLGVTLTFESENRFAILVSHLLWHLEQRTLMLEPPGTIRRAVQSYLPFAEYINDCIRESQFSVTLWHQRTTWSEVPGPPRATSGSSSK